MKKVFGLFLITLFLCTGSAVAAPVKKLLIIDSQDGEPYESARIAMPKKIGLSYSDAVLEKVGDNSIETSSTELTNQSGSSGQKRGPF
nr:hypothetical protein [uncultured Desulfobacter sp.]